MFKNNDHCRLLGLPSGSIAGLTIIKPWQNVICRIVGFLSHDEEINHPGTSSALESINRTDEKENFANLVTYQALCNEFFSGRTDTMSENIDQAPWSVVDCFCLSIFNIQTYGHQA